MTSTMQDRVRTASERIFAHLLQRHDGLPPLALLDPLAAAGSAPELATAWFTLGTRLLESPFAPASAAVLALQQALRADPTDGRCLVQLAVALARAGASPAAARLAQRFANASDAGLQRLARSLQAVAALTNSIDANTLPLLPAS